MSTTYRISLSHVTLYVSGKKIINDINLDICENKVGLIGLNGSGKSTLARLMGGLISPTQGDVRVNGFDPFKDRKTVLSAVGMVFQNPDHQIIFPSVVEEISFGLINQGKPKPEAHDHVKQLLNRFGKDELFDIPVHKLSQGQRHFICLLSAIALNPDVLILDEPFTGPDTPTVNRLFHMLDAIDQARILISHFTDVLLDYDRVIWLDQGRIYRDGTARTVVEEYNLEIDRLSKIDAVTHLTS